MNGKSIFKVLSALVALALLAAACLPAEITADTVSKCLKEGRNSTIEVDGYTVDCGAVLDQAEAAATALAAATNTPGAAVPTPTAIVLPATAVVLPTAAPPAEIVSLNYDETGNDPLTAGQTKLVAEYLREAMGAGGTQAAMETAIVAIQNEAAATNATVIEGATLTLNQRQAWLVWCSNAEGADFPTDTSDVFDKLRHGPGMVWIQVPFAPEVPVRSKDTFSGCTGGDFWAVAVH